MILKGKSTISLILSIIVLVIFMISTTACTPVVRSQLSSNNDQDNNKLSGTIVFLQSYPQEYFSPELIAQYQGAINRYINKFKKLYPEVNIILETINEADLIETIANGVSKGLSPDLIITQSHFILPLLKVNGIIPLDQFDIDLTQFRRESIVQVLYQGKIYALPFTINTQLLCYNKEKVLEVPKTLSELILQARRGYSVGVLSTFDDTFWGTRIFGGRLMNSQGDLILDQNDGWIKWIEWLKSAKNEPNFILNEDPFALQDAFIEGKLAYNVCWSEQIPLLRQSLGKDKFGVALLPEENEVQASPPLVSVTILLGSVSSANQTKIALRFAQFLVNKQTQTEITNKFRSLIPANENVIFDPRLFPIQATLQEQSRSAFTFSLDQSKKMGLIIKLGREFYTRVMAGEITPEEAARELSSNINSIDNDNN